jgi:arginase
MAGLASLGTYGLIFVDAHADFYEPEKSVTGEAADMDLAIVTGRGPDILTDLHHRRPYVLDRDVIHVGQRDWAETRQYGSQDIRETSITCFDLHSIQTRGIEAVVADIRTQVKMSGTQGYWIHFDTDVLSDDINPAVDYRLPGGITFEQAETLIGSLLATGRVKGMSVTIFNPTKDETGSITRNLVDSLGRVFAPLRL